LSQQIEPPLQGNHLLANAKALVFAGSFFTGELASNWLNTGLLLLRRQLDEQILPDGAHFELSPMYHGIILMDVLDLLQLGRCYREPGLREMMPTLQARAAPMVGWLRGLLHPDGEIPFFNDAALGIAPSPSAIFDYARELGVSVGVLHDAVRYFEASGYQSIRAHDQVALLDVAAIGPDYLPGHAHADTLSFEWSLFGQRVLVNSGTGEYGLGAGRLRQRSTAAHNTVVVNGENSSEVWSGFRVARRARPFAVAVRTQGDTVMAWASHDGYHRLRPKVTHSRQWRVSPGLLQVSDHLNGRFVDAQARFHLHPRVLVEASAGGCTLRLPSGQRATVEVAGGTLQPEQSTWYPEFGLSQANSCLVATFSGPDLQTTFRY
ncbi:MAG: heparinase II/III family protein, partial [Parahaliea sp.]